MNHTLRFTPAAALACALSLSTPSAWSDDSPTDPTTGTNLFRAERRAANDVRSGRDTRTRRFAAHVKPNSFDPSAPQPDTRMFYNDGAGSRCTATAGAGTSRSSCGIKW